MVRTRWLALRKLKRQSRANVEPSDSVDPISSEAKTDDVNSRSANSPWAASDQNISSVKDAHNWISLSPQGPKPEPRYNHAAAVVGRKMVVVGGESSDGLLNDVQVLHLGKLSWLTVGQIPKREQSQQLPACKGHSLVSWGKKVLLIGGQMDPPSDHVSVWAFDMESESWSSIEAKGAIPVARSGQSVTKAGSMLILFAGEDAKGRKLKDLHIFDMKSLMWLPLQTTGSGPSPRSKHVAALYNDRFLLVFGGAAKSKALNDLFSLDFETMSWSKIKTQGSSPSSRAGCNAVLSGKNWYITGGKGRKTWYSETLVLDVSTMTWSSGLTSAKSSILNNQGFSLSVMERKEGTFLVAFGGYNGEYSNEVEVLVTMLSEESEQSCESIQKELVHMDNSSSSMHEQTPRGLVPVVASKKHPCSWITVAKHNLVSATDRHSSSQRSFSEASAGSHSSEIAGILPLRKLFEHEEGLSIESIAQRTSCESKENKYSSQPVKESTSIQGSRHFEEMETARQTNAVVSFPEADSQVLPEFDNHEIIQTKENGSAEIEEQLAWQVTCQKLEPSSRSQCLSGRCEHLPLEKVSRNRAQLAHDSQGGYFDSEIDVEGRSLSDIQEQYEIKLAAAFKKNAITENQLSTVITSKEAAEKGLSSVLKLQQKSETALSEALKEIEVLKEKVIAAELGQEEANSLSNVVHAENVRLEHDMAFLKAVLDDTQKELHTTRGILTG
ncbi:tip elongation aberrant protein 1 isoform X2 [Cryptomeria japonica]|nr:tip elongation aberrant protein 1 isoform X2 [Cryptomeria japonica]